MKKDENLNFKCCSDRLGHALIKRLGMVEFYVKKTDLNLFVNHEPKSVLLTIVMSGPFILRVLFMVHE